VEIVNNSIKNQKIIGIIQGITLDDCVDIVKQGYILIPDTLKMRLLERRDEKYIGYTSLLLPSIKNDFIVLELSTKKDVSFDSFYNPIGNALLSFRILKKGDVFLKGIYGTYENNTIIEYRSENIPPHYNGYTLNKNELIEFRELYNKMNEIDFTSDDSFSVAFARFSMYYTDFDYANKLIDLCIALEALFMRGENINPTGKVIGISCSMLLGKNKRERNQIYKDITKFYNCRNMVVHGKHTDIKIVLKLIKKIEKYLRRSLYIFILE